MSTSFIITGFADEIAADIKTQFLSLNNLGIRYFEPRGINGKNISELSDEEVLSLKEEMKKYGIMVSSIGSPIGKISITEDFSEHFEIFKRVVNTAKILGTRFIRVFSFFIPKGEKPEKYRDLVIKRLSDMIEYAEKNGVVLLHENEKGIYGEKAEECLDLMQTLYCDNFKACFDPANFVQVGTDTKKAFAMLSPYIAYMHIKDALPDGSVVPSGFGKGNVAEILTQLKDSDYNGFLSIEPHLGAFAGFETLEPGKKLSGNGGLDKFSLAYDALKKLFSEIGYNDRIIRLGIVGFGNMGSTHAANVYSGKVPKMTIGAICDISAEKCEKARSLYNVPVFTDAEEMYKSGLVDVVIVAVPHYSHPKLVEAAFEAGLDVITEKPAGVYTKQVLEMNKAAERSGRLFGIMFNQRTNPLYQKVREMVKSGELGQIKRISWVITDWYRSTAYHESATWRSTWATEGGGALVNQNPHQLDLWQWMFGMPDHIYGDCSFGKYRNIEVDDDVTAYFKYDSGTTGTYITSTGEAPGTNRLEIACDMGRIVIENGQLTFLKLDKSEPEFDKENTVPFGAPKASPCAVEINGASTQHIGILNNYAEALINGEPLLAPGCEGINGVTIANSIYYSTWTGKWVDTKTFPHDEYLRLLNEKIKTSTVTKKQADVTSDLDGTY